MGSFIYAKKGGVNMHEPHWHEGLLPHWHISTWFFWGAVIVGIIWLLRRQKIKKRKGD
tara:strand:- start:15644 stop:15817 length:174 start_codon:yes stop_codon:yes gene_type:complete